MASPRQHETVPLAIAIAEKLVARQIDSDPEILMNWIANSVHTIQSARKIQLRMNPLDASHMKSSLDSLLLEMQRTVSIELIEDEKVQREGSSSKQWMANRYANWQLNWLD